MDLEKKNMKTKRKRRSLPDAGAPFVVVGSGGAAGRATTGGVGYVNWAPRVTMAGNLGGCGGYGGADAGGVGTP